MELYIRLQAQTIAAAFALGAAAGVIYDLLRTVRINRRRRLLTHATDLLYVLAVGWALLRFALSLGQGELRLYVLPCAGLGGLFYWRLLAPVFRGIWQFWWGTAAQLWHWMGRPIRIFLGFCKKVWISVKKVIAFLKKYSKIKLYKRKDAAGQEEAKDA